MSTRLHHLSAVGVNLLGYCQKGRAQERSVMSHQRALCKCPGCPDKDTAACPYRQSENQCKELLLERKVLRQTFVESARQNVKVAEQTPTNSDLVQLLSECKDFMSLRNGSDEESTKFTRVVGRVNAVLAQQH